MDILPEIRQLYIKYLNGETTVDDEALLSRQLLNRPDCKTLMSQWEQEWKRTYVPSADAQSMWERLEAKLSICDNSLKKRLSFSHTLLYMRRIAAVLLFMLISSLVTYLVVSQRPQQYYVSSAPLGGKSMVTLPDGSRVWLNAGSTLRYSNRFNDDNRSVELDGEGYFEITKHNGKPFSVAANGSDIVVHGTKFDVSAYRDDAENKVSLFEGSVTVSNRTSSLTLKPNEEVSVNRQSGVIIKRTMTNRANAWKDGIINYSSIKFENLAKILSRKYAVNIIIMDPALRNYCFNISMRNKETVSEILDILSNIKPFSYERRNDTIYIK